MHLERMIRTDHKSVLYENCSIYMSTLPEVSSHVLKPYLQVSTKPDQDRLSVTGAIHAEMASMQHICRFGRSRRKSHSHLPILSPDCAPDDYLRFFHLVAIASISGLAP